MMNHEERLRACGTVSARLIERYPEDLVATAVTGSVARGEDLEHSDIDLLVLARKDGRIPSHKRILKGCLLSVTVGAWDSWGNDLERPRSNLPFVVGSLISVVPIHDPGGEFGRLKAKAMSIPEGAWLEAASIGLEELVEDLGRARNLRASQDMAGFRITAALVSLLMATVLASLEQRPLSTEKELSNVFERAYGMGSAEARAFEVASRIRPGSDDEVAEALDKLDGLLMGRARDRGISLREIRSEDDYHPPGPDEHLG